MFSYNFTKTTINSDKLHGELLALIGSSFKGISKVGNQVTVYSDVALDSGMQTSVASAISSHTTTDLQSLIHSKIEAAMVFGNNMMAEYGTIRVLRDLQSGDSDEVKDARTERVLDKLAKVQASCLAGSLKVALRQLQAMEPDADVSQADIDSFVLKIQNYLGV